VLKREICKHYKYRDTLLSEQTLHDIDIHLKGYSAEPL
jgi:hypothetical protein